MIFNLFPVCLFCFFQIVVNIFLQLFCAICYHFIRVLVIHLFAIMKPWTKLLIHEFFFFSGPVRIQSFHPRMLRNSLTRTQTFMSLFFLVLFLDFCESYFFYILSAHHQALPLILWSCLLTVSFETPTLTSQKLG